MVPWWLTLILLVVTAPVCFYAGWDIGVRRLKEKARRDAEEKLEIAIAQEAAQQRALGPSWTRRTYVAATVIAPMTACRIDANGVIEPIRS